MDKWKFTNPQQMRNDSAGKGHFGASRGKRKHNGIDILVKEGQSIIAPFNGYLERIAYPYPDQSYSGMVLIPDGMDGVKVKIFYAKPLSFLVGHKFSAGDEIAMAQSVSKRYPRQAMLDHIHVEIHHKGNPVNPTKYLDL